MKMVVHYKENSAGEGVKAHDLDLSFTVRTSVTTTVCSQGSGHTGTWLLVLFLLF